MVKGLTKIVTGCPSSLEVDLIGVYGPYEKYETLYVGLN